MDSLTGFPSSGPSMACCIAKSALRSIACSFRFFSASAFICCLAASRSSPDNPFIASFAFARSAFVFARSASRFSFAIRRFSAFSKRFLERGDIGGGSSGVGGGFRVDGEGSVASVSVGLVGLVGSDGESLAALSGGSVCVGIVDKGDFNKGNGTFDSVGTGAAVAAAVAAAAAAVVSSGSLIAL